MKLAMYFEKIENSKVHCYLCPHGCVIKPGMTGACRARKNIDGELYSLNYGKVSSISLDPIEKKPLYHFHPGSMILSAGTFGCNLKCSFCQNWTIAHENPGTVDITPVQLAEKAAELSGSGMALKTRETGNGHDTNSNYGNTDENNSCGNRGKSNIQGANIGIAYTYNEPFIWYEFVYETSKLIKQKGLSNVLVTNGFVSPEPLKDILPYIDAANIDVKAFASSFYSDICKGVLKNVKETVEICADKCHIEVTTLLIPGLNDSEDEVESLALWLSSISPGIPLHLSRFFPNYKMKDRPPTPVEILIRARDKASRYLNHVHLGNV